MLAWGRTMRIDDGRQVKAARAILGITARDLAREAGLCKNSVLAIEARTRIRRRMFDRNSGVARVEQAIERLGVFCEMQDGRPIVRFATTPIPPKYRRKPQPAD
ncbi:hypothetical protein GCM10011390_50280 [Aureimonas endophytica]|uniref:HTH cro/C1-type domain-containing protein n=1 Tax=Aureimonas endophytica TaxID=2027858 RepID=A0A917A3C6_9HYPH|nr:hypothetical protein GCM10011390_50280 [Aureimonas endophytica]